MDGWWAFGIKPNPFCPDVPHRPHCVQVHFSSRHTSFNYLRYLCNCYCYDAFLITVCITSGPSVRQPVTHSRLQGDQAHPPPRHHLRHRVQPGPIVMAPVHPILYEPRGQGQTVRAHYAPLRCDHHMTFRSSWGSPGDLKTRGIEPRTLS